MTGECQGTKRKKSSTNATHRLLRPRDLDKATKKLAEANKKRLKKLGLPSTTHPSSPAVQKLPHVVSPSPRVVQETTTVVQPSQVAAPTTAQQTAAVVQPSQVAAPTTVQQTTVVQPSQVSTPTAVQDTTPMVQLSQVTSPTSAQTTPHPSLEADVSQNVDGDHLENIQEGHQGDNVTKTMIRPLGQGFTPSKVGANAIRVAIRKQFQDTSTRWKNVPQEEWFQIFSKHVSWEPHHEKKIREIFNEKCPKRLTDILTKVRDKGERPSWMGEDAYKVLLKHWESDDFKKMSSQNKTNRNSSKGGAVHTTGRKAHHDMALDMSKILGRSVYPDELFLATHKKKNGDWVDSRAKKTYDNYQERLTQLIKTDDHFTTDTQEVDGGTRLQLWVDVAGGISRGHCYGTGALSVNLRPGVIHLTQESHPPENEVIEMLRREASTAREEAVAANQRADEANQRAAEAGQRTKELQNQFLIDMAEFRKRMTTSIRRWILQY